MKNLSRREFCRKSFYSISGLLAAGWLGCLNGCAAICPNKVSAKNRARKVLADLHVHPMMNDWLSRSPLAVGLTRQSPGIDKLIFQAMNPTGITWKTSHQAGVDMMCVAHFNAFDEFVSMPTDPNPDAPRNTIRMMEILERELTLHQHQYATLARNNNDLHKLTSINKQENWQDFRIAVVHALEGGHALGGQLEALNEFAHRGVAMIGITHFFNKVIASSGNSIPYFPDANSLRAGHGVSEFGFEVIKKMEELGIIVDVTHGTSTTIEDVLQNAKKPIVSSHSAARTLGDHPYSLYDEHIQQIAMDEGIIGVILMPYWLSNFSDAHISTAEGSLNDVVRTIRYMYKICGNKHQNIGIGTDFSGFITPPNDIKCHGKIDLLRQKLMVEFDGDRRIVDDILANNVIKFFKKHWQSGHSSPG